MLAKATDGTGLRLAAPCVFVRLVLCQSVGAAAVPPGPLKQRLRNLHYKGMSVDTLRAAPFRAACRLARGPT